MIPSQSAANVGSVFMSMTSSQCAWNVNYRLWCELTGAVLMYRNSFYKDKTVSRPGKTVFILTRDPSSPHSKPSVWKLSPWKSIFLFLLMFFQRYDLSEDGFSISYHHGEATSLECATFTSHQSNASTNVNTMQFDAKINCKILTMTMVASLMSPVASLVTTDRCSNVLICLLVSTKCFSGIVPLLYSVGNKSYYYYYYYNDNE